MDILAQLSETQKRAASPIVAMALKDASDEIALLRSVVQIQNDALEPFVDALKFSHEGRGKNPDINDTTALAAWLVTYDSFKEALGVYNKYKDAGK